MKRKIIGIFSLLASIICIGADLPHETTTESYSTDSKSCKNVCTPKYKKECHEKTFSCKDEHNQRTTCTTQECNDVPNGEECHEECHTETEWHTRIKELETYYVNESLKQEYEKAAGRGAKDRVKPKDSNAIPNDVTRFKKFQTGKTTEEVTNELYNECKKHIKDGLIDYSRKTGSNLTIHKDEMGRETVRISNEYINHKKDEIIDNKTRQKLHDMASSGSMRKVYKDQDGLPDNAEYQKDENRVVDPVLRPIVKKEGESISKEEYDSGRPIFRIKEKKKEESNWSNFEKEHDVDSNAGYRYYVYYSISFNANGATQGYTPSKITKIKNSYVIIPGNEGELTKKDYKMIGWNTKADGTGVTYEFGEYKQLYKDMTLYAKWEKVEKVEVPKPIENKTIYKIQFIGGEHITLNGTTKLDIEKGNKINYVPNIKVDKDYKFKHWLSSDGNIYSHGQIKNLIPKNSINFIAIIESTKEDKPVEPTPDVPKPKKVVEKYNITFTANEYSKLKGISNLEIEEKNKIGQTPQVVVDKGYEFKHWLGSDNKNYTNEEIVELIPKNNMSFLVVTKVKEIEKIEKPKPKKPELPKVDDKQKKENTETRPDVVYVPLEVYVGDLVTPEQVVDKTNIQEFLVYWQNEPNTSVVGKAKCSVKLMNLYTGTGWHDYPSTTINVLPKPELSYKHDTLELNSKVKLENCINKTLSDRYEVVITNTIDTSTIGKKEVELKVIDRKLNREFTGYKSYVMITETMEKLPFEHDYIYITDTVKLEDILNVSKVPGKYKVEIINQPDTTTIGNSKPMKLRVSNPTSGSVWEVDFNVNVINKPSLIYKDVRKKLINKEITTNDVVEYVTIKDYSKFNKDYYRYEITNTIDNTTIGKKVIELKVIDLHKNREFTGYTTDITLYENLENLNYKPDPEIYEGDDTKVDDIIDKKDIPSKYNITIKIPADSKTPGRKITRIIISNPTSGSVWEVDRPITVLPKPTLVYKNPRRKHINNEIIPDDVVANKLDDRYTIHITNEIDIKTIGLKPVELKIVDNKLNREFVGFKTDITLYEDLLELNYKPNPEIYVGDPTTVDDIINKKDIPSIYKIEIKTPADSTTPGRKTTKIKISNPTSGSVWEVDRPIEVLPEPELIGKDLWIYQNDKDPDDKGRKFISKITVDLNNRFKGRYKVEYKGHGDISKVGKTKFTYIIIDLQRNRKFEKQIEVEVREEIINPKFNENTERYIGHIFTPDELVEGIDKTVYIPEITNKEEMMEFRLTPGKKTVKIKITSTITGKVWTYDIPVIYKEKIVDLGELLWEKGEILTIEDIRKHKNLPKDHTITIRKGDLDTTQLGSKTIELVIMDKDRVYYVGILKITIVENKTIEDIHRIDDGTKVHLITYVDDISNRATKKLINKSKDLWFEQTNNFLKYNLDQKANIIGGRLGYDHYFENQKAVLGGYAGYDRATWNLSDKSKQNMFHIGMYGAKELHESNSGKNKLYLGGVTQYTFINGDINVKNIRNERITYKQTAHNILANAFVGTSYEYSENSNIALNLGDTLLYNFNNKYIGKTQNVNLKNNIANEFYVELMANKRWNKLNVHSTLKLGYLYGKTEYSLNKAVWNYVLKKFNIKATAGADYDVTDNFTIGVEGFYKHHDKNIKLDAGIKGKLEYRW